MAENLRRRARPLSRTRSAAPPDFLRRAGALLVLVALVGDAARAEPPAPGPAIAPPIARDLDAFLPRTGAWPRALDAARAGRYRTAQTLALDAAAELRRTARGHATPCITDGSDACLPHPPRALVRALLRKTTWLLRQLRALAEADPLPRPGTPGAAETRLDFAVALDNLYLAVRAYEGREPPDLGPRAERAWRDALLASIDDPDLLIRARLGLAGLLANRGDRKSAAEEFARVPATQRTPALVEMIARYHAAMSDPESAFEALQAARDALPEWDELATTLRVENDLDALRGDPRWVEVMGAE